MIRRIGTLFYANQRFLPLLATIVLFFAAYTLGMSFFQGMQDPQVFFNLFISSPFLLISAIGETFVIISGGIDLSVSGVVALTTVASAALLRAGWNPWMVMLLMLGMGMALGAIMGAFITYLKVQPFIATLAGMWFARGMCYFISDDAIKITDPVYKILGQTKILIPGLADPVTKQGDYISPLVVLMLVVFGVAIYGAHYTRFGRTVYAMGGNNGANEQSARLMGLPVNRIKVLVYTLNGFCSALGGIALSMYVGSGHGSYAPGFEMTVIAAVVIGGTMLTGGEGYVFGTLFGVLVYSVIQTLIQFNGKLSSWWTSIAIGLLTLVFIGVQSLLAARKSRQLAASKRLSQAKEKIAVPRPGAAGPLGRLDWLQPRGRRILLFGGTTLILLVLVLVAIVSAQSSPSVLVTNTSVPTSIACQLKPFRQEQVADLMKGGAVIVYERNGGPDCIDELFAVYPDGRIEGDDGAKKTDKQVAVADVEKLLTGIGERGWFTEEMYSTSHTPCGQCYSYYLTVYHQGQQKTVQAVDGGTDAPANYWQVVSLLNGVIPKLTSY